MATYRSIVGQKIKKVTSDPSNPIEGQMWYNSTSGSLKVHLTQAASWASGGNMNTARRLLSGLGTQTASLGWGGYVGPSTNA